MPKTLLSDAGIRALTPGTYFDTRTPNFGIRVGKNRKTWIVLRGARSTKHRLGHYPALSLSLARRKAFAIMGTPLNEAAPTFPDAIEAFLEAKKKTLRASSYYQLDRTLRVHFHWTKTLDKISHTDISASIDAIKAPSETWHAFKDIRSFFNWCVPKYIPHSPCAGLKSPTKYVPRKRLLTEEEVKKIWTAAGKMGAYGLQVRRIIATGQRPNQIFSLKPEWVKDGLLQFPDTVMKNKLAHHIPYGPLTKTLLTDFPFVTNQGKFKKELDEKAGVTGYTLQDIRKFYSSTHARLKTPIDITEQLLSHITGSRSPIQRVYDLYDRLDDMREAVHKYEQYLITCFAD